MKCTGSEGLSSLWKLLLAIQGDLIPEEIIGYKFRMGGVRAKA